jgi:hypothetical protein
MTINTDGAAKVPIIVRSGNTVGITATFTEGESPKDLTGCKFFLYVTQGASTVDMAPDITLGGSDNNILTIKSLIRQRPGAYTYELKITNPADATAITYLYGPFTVN